MTGPHLLHLKPGEPLYTEVANRFKDGWKHPNKTANITDIFYIIYEGPAAQQHLQANRSYLQQIESQTGMSTKQAESYLFHGTQRACTIGEDASHTTTCSNRDCHLCSIIRCSFQLKYIGETNLLGKGFYTSVVSSKADGYAKNTHIQSQKHAMFLGNVVTGKKELVYQYDQHKPGPAPGYHSVEAVPKSQGGTNINYSETVVYREEAIIPSIVVMYTRTGWTPNS